jgi:hypothetical protein
LPDGGEFGVLLNVSRTDLRFLDAEISKHRLPSDLPARRSRLAADPRFGTSARFPDIQRLFYRSGRRMRPSVNGAMQWRPNRNLEFYVEGLWQGFRIQIDDRLLAAELFNGAQASSLQFREGTNLVRSGTVLAPAARSSPSRAERSTRRIPSNSPAERG